MASSRRTKALGRRQFLHCSLCASLSALFFGCGRSDARGGSPGPVDAGGDVGAGADAGSSGCADPFVGGTMLEVLSFLNEDIPLGVRFNEGLDGRLFADLTYVDRDGPVVPNERFFIRTMFPDRLVPPSPWRIDVGGLVEAPTSLTVESDITPLSRSRGIHLLECSGNGGAAGFGMISVAEWSGVPMKELLPRLRARPEATRVLISGFDDHSRPSAGGRSTPGASWIFTFDELESSGAFLATEMNGEPLPPDHGQPVRLYVPGWYGCTCIKWVNEIRFVNEAEPATSQMQEFALRTHQAGIPELAREYQPATIDQAAMPIRIEKWRLASDEIGYRVIGIMWGGSRPTDKLLFSPKRSTKVPVDVCPPQETNATWTVWQHLWSPSAPGEYELRMHIDDPTIRTRRLDAGYYARTVRIDEV